METCVCFYTLGIGEEQENTSWVLVGVVETLESHLSGICERQQREKNVRPLTFMDSTFTGYTVYGLSPGTFVKTDR